MTKEQWYEALEQLREELGREPSDGEVAERAIDNYTSEIDALYDRLREEGC